MFNSPRPGVRYNSNLGGSFVSENPLSSSAYDGLDPWSAAPSPVTTPPPPAVPSVFSNVIADAVAPPIYTKSFQAADTALVGEVSVNSLSRVLGTSMLPAATIDRIVNLVSSRPRVSKLEFFIALALVALAQSGKDLSIEQVAALASQNSLPIPTLDLNALSPPSTFPPTVPRPQYSSDDPWNTSFRNIPGVSSNSNGIGGAALPSSISLGGGLPPRWWERQESVSVSMVGQQGFLLGRHMVYRVTAQRGSDVQRRYSEFVFLWDCFVRRYPFRILPPLPPKRIGPDANFLEQRRRGLARWLKFIVNHPVLKEDGILSTFLTEPSFEEWRKHASVSLEEESASKRVDRMEEMTIPSDLEEKLHHVRQRLRVIIEQWQRICLIAERMVKRREAAAADMARLTMTLNALVEVSGECWRGAECEMCSGTMTCYKTVARHTQVASNLTEQRMEEVSSNLVEEVKGQRDLYLGMRELFSRHDRLSGDQVERIRKRVEGLSQRLESIKGAQREGWAEEADKVISAIERDQGTIGGLLARRVFIRQCMWHELRVVLHNRENTLIVQAVQRFAKEEREFADGVHTNWFGLGEGVEGIGGEFEL